VSCGQRNGFPRLFILEELLIPFNTLAESKKIIQFCSESIFSIISRVSPVASASAVNVDAIMEKHNFWDCKLYKDQRARMVDILSESNKKEYLESVTELLWLEEKRFVQGACYFISNIPMFI
jgi:hypothetical protein